MSSANMNAVAIVENNDAVSDHLAATADLAGLSISSQSPSASASQPPIPSPASPRDPRSSSQSQPPQSSQSSQSSQSPSQSQPPPPRRAPRRPLGTVTAGMAAQCAEWFARATEALTEKATSAGKGSAGKSSGGSGGSGGGGGGKNNSKNSQLEARQRAAALSTSSSTVGVSFAGATFQADYFQRLFQKRGELASAVLRDLDLAGALPWRQTATALPPSDAAPVSASVVGSASAGTSASSNLVKASDSICSFGSEAVAASTSDAPSTPSTAPSADAETDEVRVASFGGGPGTDAAGLVWLQRWHFPRTAFSVTLYDYETTWKKYVGALQEQFGPRVRVAFAPCNVIAPLDDEQNRRVDVADSHLLLFFYVCHETSSLTASADLVFYTDVARRAMAGAIAVFADVKEKSRAHLSDIVGAMQSVRSVTAIELPSRGYGAEVVALRF